MHSSSLPRTTLVGRAATQQGFARLLREATGFEQAEFIGFEPVTDMPRSVRILFLRGTWTLGERPALFVGAHTPDYIAQDFFRDELMRYDPVMPPSPCMVKGWEVRRLSDGELSVPVAIARWINVGARN